MICAAAGFFMNGAIVGMYAIFAQAFPTHVRAFGTGFAIGVGRGGSVLAPILAGLLLQLDYGLRSVALTMSLGSLVAVVYGAPGACRQAIVAHLGALSR